MDSTKASQNAKTNLVPVDTWGTDSLFNELNEAHSEKSRRLLLSLHGDLSSVDRFVEDDKSSKHLTVVTHEPYYDHVYQIFDDLDTLSQRWWNFDQLGSSVTQLNEAEPDILENILNKSFNDSELSELPLPQHGHQRRAKGRKHEKQHKGCRCKMSKCLRLHCRCFKDLEYCRTNCKCTGCFNDEKFDAARSFVISKTREINRQAFASKVVVIENEANQVTNTINADGCTCKTGCNRNYCECFKNKTGCSSICRCIGCKNDTLDFPHDKAQKIFKTLARTKNKIVIENTEQFIKNRNSQSSNFIDDGEQSLGPMPNEKNGLVVAYHNYKKIKLDSTHV